MCSEKKEYVSLRALCDHVVDDHSGDKKVYTNKKGEEFGSVAEQKNKHYKDNQPPPCTILKINGEPCGQTHTKRGLMRDHYMNVHTKSLDEAEELAENTNESPRISNPRLLLLNCYSL